MRLGQQDLTPAYGEDVDVDSEGNLGFHVLLPCPVDAEGAGQAWAPAYSVIDLHKALTAPWTTTQTSSAPSAAAPVTFVHPAANRRSR